MKRTVAKTMTTIDAAELIRNQIGEHIQEKVEKIQEQKAVARGHLRRMMDVLFCSEPENRYDLSPAMRAKLYL